MDHSINTRKSRPDLAGCDCHASCQGAPKPSRQLWNHHGCATLIAASRRGITRCVRVDGRFRRKARHAQTQRKPQENLCGSATPWQRSWYLAGPCVFHHGLFEICRRQLSNGLDRAPKSARNHKHRRGLLIDTPVTRLYCAATIHILLLVDKRASARERPCERSRLLRCSSSGSSG